MTGKPRPSFPTALSAALELDFQDDDYEGFDFEPYAEFMSVQDTEHWIRAWTGNKELSGEPYLIFGQDGTGGYAALWLQREGADLLDQPVVFFGSEGACGPVARNVYEFLWLLAGGVGPLEAVEQAGHPIDADILEPFRQVASLHAAAHELSAAEALAAAQAEFPTFAADMRALCGH